MGYAIVMGNCYACGQFMRFNPVRVPSIRVSGVREPVCRACIERANPLREQNGLDPIAIHPDAYEACEESELP